MHTQREHAEFLVAEKKAHYILVTIILSFRVSQGCDLRRPVVDSVTDGTLAA